MSNRKPHGVPSPDVEIESAELEASASSEAELILAEAKEKALAKISKGKINVVATRPGFYKQSRKSEGDKFTIEGENELGDWMKKI